MFGSAKFSVKSLLGMAMLVALVGLPPEPAAANDDPFVKISYSPAKKGGKALCRTKYPAKGKESAAFHHVEDKSCWSCPTGYKRSKHPLSGKKACHKKEHHFSAANKRGSFGCAKGSFRHGLEDQCYICPAKYKRSLAPGKDLSKVKHACVGVKVTPAAVVPQHVKDWAAKNLAKIGRDYGSAIKEARTVSKELNTKANKKALRELRRKAKKGKAIELPAQSGLKKLTAVAERTSPNGDLSPLESTIAGNTARANDLIRKSIAVNNGKGCPNLRFVYEPKPNVKGDRKIKTLSFGLVLDASLIGGVTYSPMMVAKRLNSPYEVPASRNSEKALERAGLAFYTAVAGNAGATLGLDGTGEVGLWVDKFDNLAGNTWGFTLGGTYGAGGAVTVWLTYSENPLRVAYRDALKTYRKARKKDNTWKHCKPRKLTKVELKSARTPVKFSGITVAVSAGISAEAEIAVGTTSRVTWDALKSVM